MANFRTCDVHIDYDRNDCLISVPQSISEFHSKKIFAIQTPRENVTVYCGWNGKFSGNQNSIEVSPHFASLAGLAEGENVILSSIARFQTCRRLVLSPLASEDWSLIHQNADLISLSLMDRVVCVWVGMVIPIHVQSNLMAKAKVIGMCPSIQFTCLREDTELHFEPEEPISTAEAIESITVPSLSPSSSFFTSLIGSMFKSGKQVQEPNRPNSGKMFEDSAQFSKLKRFPSTVILRHVPLHDQLTKSCEYQCNTVYISNDQFANFRPSIAHLFLIPPPHDTPPSSSDQESKKKHATSTIVLVMADDRLALGQSFLCPSLHKQLAINGCHRFLLAPLSEASGKTLQQSNHLLSSVHKVQVCTSLQLIPLKPCTVSSIDLLNAIDEITPEYGILVVDGTLLSVKSNDFLVRSEICLIIKQKSIQQVTVDEYDSTTVLNLLPKPLACSLSIAECRVDPFYGFEDLIVQFSSSVASALRVEHPYTMTHSSGKSSSFIALIGPRGSGKTHLIKHCIRKYIEPPHSVAVKWIDCKVLRGRRVDALNKLLMKEFGEVAWIQPAILIVEDLNHLTSSSEKPTEASNVELFYLHRVSRLMIQIKSILQTARHMYGAQLLVIATAFNEQSLHDAIIKSNYFDSIYHLKPPEADDRRQIIAGLISSLQPSVHLHHQFALELVVQKTEAYLPADLKILITQAIHCLLMGDVSPNDDDVRTLHTEHVLQVLDKYKPLNLRKIKFAPSSSVTLSSVGGLEQVKETLMETIEWSSKYPNLMSKCPLRPASCILLYGAPGTGKTLLAQAIANHTGVNFLSISGPELLSKYIGASELAIRDLFASAEAAKPCIVFFDEFDSIAPRRGHDSTGVTDRVVNQLLTQMDGVEGIDRSIFIVAATSRPDLLDPALLRPGRFDLTLHCDLPTIDDRLNILKAIASNINLAPDVDLTHLAAQTEGYTGADLHAILYTAQMTSARRSVGQGAFNIDRAFHREPPPLPRPQVDATRILILDRHLQTHRTTSLPDDMVSTLRKLKITRDASDEEETCHSQGKYTAANDTSTGDKDVKKRLDSLVITQMNIEDALKSTQPSIGPIEREKYTRIYHDFQLGRMRQATHKKRVTLA